MIVEDIVEQHWEEACILWSLRSSAVHRSAFNLATLGELDERIEAHLDGLRVAGDEGRKLCEPLITGGDAGELFAAGVLALEDGDEERIERLVALAGENPSLARGLISAVGWLPIGKVSAHIDRWLVSTSSVERFIGVSAASICRLPMRGVLENALRDEDKTVRARALRAAGELGRVDVLPELRRQLPEAKDARCFWAAWSLALLGGENAALDVLSAYAKEPGPFQGRAIALLFRRLSPAAAKKLHQAMAASPEQRRLAIQAAASTGDPEFVPWLLTLLSNPEVQRPAADAFATITGVDFIQERLRLNSPPRPSAADDSDDVQLGPDADLAWVDPSAVRRWWTQHEGGFMKGARHLLGKPVSPGSLRVTLSSGHQGQREAAALELAIATRQPLFEVRAHASQQSISLAKLSAS